MKQSWSWNMNNNLKSFTYVKRRSYITPWFVMKGPSTNFEVWVTLHLVKYRMEQHFEHLNFPWIHTDFCPPIFLCLLMNTLVWNVCFSCKKSPLKNNFAISCCHLRIIVFEILWQGKEFFWLLKATFNGLFWNSMVLQVSKSPSGQSLC